MSELLYKFCDEFKCNLTAKRHNGRDKPSWDMRISHPWINGPILTAASKSTIEDCINELAERVVKIPEGMRMHLRKKNEARDKKFAEDAKYAYDETDEWVERIY